MISRIRLVYNNSVILGHWYYTVANQQMVHIENKFQTVRCVCECQKGKMGKELQDKRAGVKVKGCSRFTFPTLGNHCQCVTKVTVFFRYTGARGFSLKFVLSNEDENHENYHNLYMMQHDQIQGHGVVYGLVF